MRSLISAIERTDPLVADASAVINVSATGRAHDILRALPNKLVVVDIVVGELDNGCRQGRTCRQVLENLIQDGLAQVVKLDAAAEKHFESLVIGAGPETLDDGEAASIAYAYVRSGIAIIGCTIDIFCHSAVERGLGRQGINMALFEALQRARMGVAPQYIPWVLDRIGPERAALCPSLPRRINLADAV